MMDTTLVLSDAQLAPVFRNYASKKPNAVAVIYRISRYDLTVRELLCASCAAQVAETFEVLAFTIETVSESLCAACGDDDE